MIKTSSIKKVRDLISEQKKNTKSVGLVPTMGAFHEGHESLIKKARKENDYVVVSIFVNPAQFAPNEDYNLYPRDIKSDLLKAENNGADLVFMPNDKVIYPEDYSTYVTVEELTDKLEGKSRPSHFRGVTTIVTKLLNIVTPDNAYFGQKDAQQLAVVKRMVKDLNMPVKIVGCPIIRNQSGIALSSRHHYLNRTQMKTAVGIYESLKEGVKMIKSGTSDFGAVKERILDVLQNFGIKRIDYVEFNKWESLEPLRKPEGKVLISLAVRIGNTRLLDNVILDSPRL
ncbi:MAG: pantoate--beta-alanine ligase [candidate division Zixibacteria bacterium]|nr:pantoate--beta-alanine ligase [candidate division Zixibacteria bacterium]